METLQAIILGAVQGLTEFIPISSSAHLVVVPWVFDWQTPGLVFDVALHLGTLFALLAYFWREWYDMVKAYMGTTRAAGALGLQRTAPAQTILLWPIVFACLPAGFAGMYFEHTVERSLRTPVLIAIVTIGLGAVLLAADLLGAKRRPMHAITTRDWIVIGLAQALAIIPGVSRSGVTITAGLFCGLEREASARFSFLLGAPIIFGAAVYELSDLFSVGLPAREVLPFVLGVVTATAVGYLCIGFLMDYLRKRSVAVFVLYRVLFGGSVILMSLLRQ